MSAQQISWMVTHFSCLASFSLPWTTILHLTLNGTRHVPERTWQLLPLSPLRGTPMCHFAFHVILTQPPTSFSVKIMIVVHLKHFMLVASSLTITNIFFYFSTKQHHCCLGLQMKPAYMTREVHVTGSISYPTLFQPLLLPPLQPLQLALTNDKRRRGHKAAEESGYLTVIVRSYSLAGREMWRACHLPLAIRSAYANGTEPHRNTWSRRERRACSPAHPIDACQYRDRSFRRY